MDHRIVYSEEHAIGIPKTNSGKVCWFDEYKAPPELLETNVFGSVEPSVDFLRECKERSKKHLILKGFVFPDNTYYR